MEPNLGNKYHPDYKTAKSNGLIENGILCLTEALYSNDCFPLSSCEGHQEKFGIISSLVNTILYGGHKSSFRPFVMFTGSMGFAKELSNKLTNNPTLFYSWVAKAHFNPITNELVWTIEPSDYRLGKGHVDMAQVQKDISELSGIVTSIKV